MYLDHYHLKAKPFDLSPGPRFLWLGEKHKEALATLTYGISEDLGFLLLTGDVGVGKTALIHRLIKNLDSSTIVAHITDPGLGTIDFFKLLAVEFNIPTEFYSKAPFLIELEKFLYAAYSDQKKVLLIVDEAQRLNNKLLDQIRVLSNIELTDRKLINIFFVGQPEFKKMLMANSNRAIRQRIAINYHIHPLTESETGHYIDHRLMVAGATRKIFKSNAIREIFRFTGGYPRAINIICDHALLTGYASGIQSIDSDVIKECEQELNIRAGFDFSRPVTQTPTDTTRPETSQPPPRRSMSMGVPILIALIVVLGALAGYYLLWPAPRWTTAPDAQNQLADASSQQSGTVAEAPPSIAENIQKATTQASPKNEIARTQPDKQTEPRDKATPDEELTAADGEPLLFSAQASPAPEPLPYISAVDSIVTVPGKAGADAAVVADLAPRKDSVAQEARPAQKADPDTGGQAAVPAGEAAVEPVPSTDAPAVDSPVTAAGKAAAAMVAVLAAEPRPTVEPAPRKETVVQDAPPALEVDTSADRQTAVPTAEASPKPAPSTELPAVESDATTPGKAGAGAAVVAVLAAAKPSSQLKPSNVKKPSVIESESKAKSPSSPPKADESSKKADSNNQNQAKKKTQPEQGSPVNRPEPPSTAKAETQLQTSVQRIGGTAPSLKKPDKNDLENRLRSFLQNYSNTYAARDFDAFTNLFIPDARENGTPFIRLLPKYKKNFELIEAIEYRIEMQQFSYDENMGIVKVDGDFFLKWLPPDKKWRENSGKISMSLQEKGPSFLVRQLDYQGGRAKKK